MQKNYFFIYLLKYFCINEALNNLLHFYIQNQKFIFFSMLIVLIAHNSRFSFTKQECIKTCRHFFSKLKNVMSISRHVLIRQSIIKNAYLSEYLLLK